MKNTNDEFNLDAQNVQNTGYLHIIKDEPRHSGQKLNIFSRQMQSNCEKDKTGREQSSFSRRECLLWGLSSQ